MKTEAYISYDRCFRYWLLRQWDEKLPINCMCGVNPSTADETENDPTIRKDMKFSENQGFGGLLKINLSAYRSTDPIRARNAPRGIENTADHLRKYFDQFKCQQFVACWGRNGNYFRYEVREILRLFPGAFCFGRNSDGTPKHTLMLPYSSQLITYGV